ncbi:GGDEF domain-containing protein [Caulobacter sp. S45]|uniref:GGDEF domain-containing protein n=1 Tax=Caulobacter sp. S45 TaxID=1641861 RepID=UPI00157567D8|nr:GGDEF domain-containing protein [Caulobacter sp. S45]
MSAEEELRAEIARLASERDAALAEAKRLKRRLAEVEQLADRDPLTPVLNRRAFLRELQRTAAFCARYGAPAALVYLDLDGFKAVNDRYGHAAGDAMLEAVAQGLLDNVRESDVVARLGGDEFAVLLAQADAGAAMAKAASLTTELEGAPVVFEGRAIAIRISAGVRTYERGLTPAQWVAEADAAMFVRKGALRLGSPMP